MTLIGSCFHSVHIDFFFLVCRRLSISSKADKTNHNSDLCQPYFPVEPVSVRTSSIGISCKRNLGSVEWLIILSARASQLAAHRSTGLLGLKSWKYCGEPPPEKRCRRVTTKAQRQLSEQYSDFSLSHKFSSREFVQEMIISLST